MPRQIVITCECCQLPQLVPDKTGYQRAATRCEQCWTHRGNDEGKLRQRADDHLEMYLVRLEAARGAAKVAEVDRDRYKEKMHAAYRSRETAIRHLRSANDLHALKGDGACSCGVRKGCRTADVLYRPWVQSMIRKLDEIDEQREREQNLVSGNDELAWLWDQHSEDDGEGRGFRSA